MKKFIIYIILGLTVLVNLTSCKDDPVYDEDIITTQTLLVYMPWTGTATKADGLYTYLTQNLDSIKAAILAQGLDNRRVIVYFNNSANSARLYELTVNGNQIQEKDIKEYSGTEYTTAEGIADIITTAFTSAPALNYAMIIGSHAMGWTYKEDWLNYPYYAKSNTQESNKKQQTNPLANWNQGDNIENITRFYGSVSDISSYGVDLNTLKEALLAAEGNITYPATESHKLQYLLFDDCYMANVETAYEIKDVTNYLIASTSEVMGEGMPYRRIFNYLSSASPSYSSIVSTFYSYYNNKKNYPYGELSAIDCRQLDNLAEFMNRMNAKYTLADSLRDSIQVLDGFSHIQVEPLFYDMTDYINHLGLKNSELENYNDLISKVVYAHQNTTLLYSNLSSIYGETTFNVNTCCGLTISDLSLNTVAIKGKEKTAWWKATHTATSN